MLKLRLATKRLVFSLSTVLLPLLLTAACGLGMDNAERLARGQDAFEKNDYRAAIIDAKTILQQAPQNREARLLLGRAALRAHDGATAEKELRRAVELGIELRAVVVDLGRAMLSLGQFDALLAEIQPELAQSDSDRLAILRLRGDALLRLERPASARDVYLKVLAADGKDMAAKLGVASSYVAEDNFAEARRVVDDALAIDSENVAAWLASGSLYLTMRDAGPAAESFSQALELAAAIPDTGWQVSALVGLVEARLAARDLPAAKTAAVKLHELAPDSLTTIYLAGRIAFLEQDYELAQAKLQQVLSAAPESHQAEFLLGAVHLRRGNLGQAEMYLSSVVAAVPDNADARRLLAEIRLRQNRAAEAAAILGPLSDPAGASASTLAALDGTTAVSANAGQAVQPDPRQVAYRSRMNQARDYMQAGDFDAAEHSLWADGGIDLDDLQASVLTAALRARQGDAEGAMKIAKDLQSRHPDSAIPLALEAELLADDERYAESAKVYDEALALGEIERRLAVRAFRVRSIGKLENPVAPLLSYLDERPLDAELRLVVAEEYRASGETERAIAEYEQVLTTSPDNLVALNNLAWEYFQKGDARAEEIARKAFRQAPENGAVADTLGWIQVKTGKLAEGVATLRKAAEFSEGNAEIRYHLAVGLAAVGDESEARRILTETLADVESFASRRDAEQLLESL